MTTNIPPGSDPVPATVTREERKTYRPKHLTAQDIRDGCLYLTNGDENETRICVVNEELRQGIDIIDKWDKSVTFFGSARTVPAHPHYQRAYRLAKRVAEMGYAVISGGGPGIMEAANKGAHDIEGANSVGLTIQLPFEQHTNIYVNNEVSFYYFFTRKVALAYSAEVYLYFCGGYGTLDELFGIITLIQTGKIERVPIILVGTDFWGPLDAFIKNTLRDEFGVISPKDIDLYTITDDEDLIMDIIKNAPIRTGE